VSLSLKLNHPHLEAGAELGVAGTLAVKNGESVDVTKEQEAEFISATGQTITDALGNTEIYELSGTPEIKGIDEVLPPDQVEAIKNTDPASLGIRVPDKDAQPVKETTTTTTQTDTTATSDGADQGSAA
jgi:hypothetical protein